VTETIRVEASADVERIREVNRQAFERVNEADLVDALRRSPAFIPDLSLVAEQEGRIVGHVLFSRVTVRSEHGEKELLALAPVAVLPELQRQGVGSRLIREGLERAASLGHRGVVLIGHPEYYPRFGFVPAARFGLRTEYEVPGEAWMALPLRPGWLDGISGLVVYPPAFREV
jgi:putative acetyltransferase